MIIIIIVIIIIIIIIIVIVIILIIIIIIIIILFIGYRLCRRPSNTRWIDEEFPKNLYTQWHGEMCN